ncbi:thiamine-binding protein [Halorussus caseinilyticus]|uniref:thiamine-binding protein n=1 Tax=Halorussus caseinilyticus TaxID=3034025 RepID=UPI003075DB0F
MSVVARLEVIPTREGSMTDAVASAVGALEDFEVSYETTPTDTIIEADDPTEVFAAAEAAHRSVTDERVITSLEIDDQRNRTQRRQERVASVERRLGRPAKRERQQMSERQQTAEPRQSAERKQSPAQDTRQSAGETGRYGGPWNPPGRPTESGGTESRYLQATRPITR